MGTGRIWTSWANGAVRATKLGITPSPRSRPGHQGRAAAHLRALRAPSDARYTLRKLALSRL